MKPKSMESRFEKKFMADGELLVPGEGIDDAKDILAFIRKELKANDKKWRARIEPLRKLAEIDTGAIPETDDYANGWNDCRQKIYKHRKKLVLEALDNLLQGEV